jgi:hypothetical protein
VPEPPKEYNMNLEMEMEMEEEDTEKREPTDPDFQGPAPSDVIHLHKKN